MSWVKSGSTTVNSGDDCDIDSMESSQISQVITNVITSGTTFGRIRFNDDSGNLYNRRGSSNGGGDFTGQATEIENTHNTDTDKFTISYLCDVDSKEKLLILSYMDNGATGAATPPNRMEFTFKYVPSPSARITSAQLYNTEPAGSFTTSTNLTVLGTN
jgi:hypothetical protein